MSQLVDSLEVLLKSERVSHKSLLLVIYLDLDVLVDGGVQLWLEYLDHLVRLVVLPLPVWQV